MPTLVDLGALGTSGFLIQGDNPADQAGRSVSDAGDFNGDGFDDIIVGAPYNDSGDPDSGAAYLIYGHAGGFGTIDLGDLHAAQGFQITQHRSDDMTGMSVSAAGDVNGDGFDDIVVGAAGHGLLGYGSNVIAWVIFGSASQPAGMDLIGLPPAQGFAVLSGIGTTYTGTVAGAGDVNGDGFADIIMGSPGDNNHQGAAYVIFGGAASLGSHGFVIDATPNLGLSNVGLSVSSAGDVNGDGFDDVAVAALNSGFYGGSFPSTWIVFGHAEGFGTIDLTALTPSSGFEIRGGYSYGDSVFTVSGAGDVNGDGFADIIVGSRYAYGYSASAYVIFGRADGFGTIDVSALSPGTGFAIHGNNPSTVGGFTVSGAGDVNGDGFDDVLVGAPGADAGGENAGDTYLVFGKASGFAAIDLQNLAPADGFILHGSVPGTGVGSSVSAAGDVNGDGAGDLIVGAQLGDLGGTDAGQAYVIFGTGGTTPHVHQDFNGDGRSDILWRSAGGDLSDWLGTASGGLAHNDAHASNWAPTNWSVIGTGDFNGDNRDDILWRSDTGALSNWLASASGGFANNDSNAASWAPANWTVVGIGDFNGDNRDDILWRSDTGSLSDWLGSGGGRFTHNDAHASNWAPVTWTVAATGDFNGDGREDILWRNDTGALSDWLGRSNGGFVNNDANAAGWAPTNWTIAATGDFNGDGRDDILWRSDSGQLSDWLGTSTGGFLNNDANASNFAPLNWSVNSVGDYNGDGRDDVLWRSDTGALSNWLGTTTGGFLNNDTNASSFAPTNWHVEPPIHLL